MNHRIHLKQLREAAPDDWIEVRKGLIEGIPPYPVYRPGMDDDEWKYLSAIRVGYLQALSLLEIEYGD